MPCLTDPNFAVNQAFACIMKNIEQLSIGFSDAENYRQKENKLRFNRIFLRTAHLDKLCHSNISFLVGDKGTGKTAYSVFLANNEYKDTLSTLKFIRETEYIKFVSLKQSKHLQLSDFTSIWSVILQLLLCEQIRKAEPKSTPWDRFGKFRAVSKAIDDYYANAFTPEILQAVRFVEESRVAAGLLSKYASIEGEERKETEFNEQRFQTNLFYIQRKFQDALNQLKLTKHHLLFIDGIDIRPGELKYKDYIECIKGLANAVWTLNNDILANIRDSKGRLRVVLLLRPDIFDSLGLQNQNTKLRDNAVFLDWRTTYAEHRNSNLFLATDRLLGDSQSDFTNPGEAWDHYFPFESGNIKVEFQSPSSFVGFLRFSFYRPRDIVTMLSILRDLAVQHGFGSATQFKHRDFNDVEFRKRYAQYLLGEVKDQLMFYHRREEWDVFLRYFEFLQGRTRFTYEEHQAAYEELLRFLKSSRVKPPYFLRSANDLLQFLYQLNVICFFDESEHGENWMRWCFRERSYANISPKVAPHTKYEVHYGLAKALKLGKPIKRSRQNPKKGA